MIWKLWFIHLSIRFITTPTLNCCSCRNKKAVRLTLLPTAFPILWYKSLAYNWRKLVKEKCISGWSAFLRLYWDFCLFIFLFFFANFLFFYFTLFFWPYSLITHKFSWMYYFSFMPFFWQFKQFGNMQFPYWEALKTPKYVF